MNFNSEQFFKCNVAFLNEFKWLFDFQMTELFCHSILDKHFPEEWVDFFREFTIKQVDEMVNLKSYETYSNLPSSLRAFFTKINQLEESSRPFDYTADVSNTETFIGLTEKKQYEIKAMMPFIRDLCIKNDIKYLIDIGSGLGHFDKYLVKNSNVSVIGVEKQASFVEGANKRQLKSQASNENSSSNGPKRIMNMSFTIDDNCEANLITLIAKTMNENDPGSFEKNRQNIGMISLHSCGDLTPSMMKVFEKNKEGFKFMAAFSCCYHSMVKLTNSEGFKNFPMSQSLIKIMNNECFELSIFGLRLACQQNISTLTKKDKQEQDLHMKQVAYRAILQKFCNERGLKINKLKRKLAGKDEFKSFENYIEFVNERITFTKKGENEMVRIENLPKELLVYYKFYSKYFEAIEPLTYLQLLLQPLIERLILHDRVAYLMENKISSSCLIKLFNSFISPRCVCILSEK